MIRTVFAALAALAALAVSIGYYYVLNDGYGEPTEIAGTLFRFAGSTGTVLFLVIAVLVAFPRIVAIHVRRVGMGALAIGWLLLEIAAMAFSLTYDYMHLDQDAPTWGTVQGLSLTVGLLLMVFGVVILLSQSARTDEAWVLLSLVFSVGGVAAFLVIAVLLRSVLFVVPAATLITVILAPILRARRGARAPVVPAAATDAES